MLSRREWLLWLSGVTGGALAFVGRVGAVETKPAKINKEKVKYQEHPHEMQMCGMCKFYVPPNGRPGAGMMGGGMMGGMMRGGHMGMMKPGTCEVVEGVITPMGWCVLYQQASAEVH